MGTLRVMSRGGDDQIRWDVQLAETRDPEAMAAVREAERIFRDQQARGATAYRVKHGRAPVHIEQFDPTAEQIVMVPRVVGG
jgi:hypothetical protein